MKRFAQVTAVCALLVSTLGGINSAVQTQFWTATSVIGQVSGSLTQSQKIVLKNDLDNTSDPELQGYRDNGNNAGIRDWYNRDSSFWVWKTSVSISELGGYINMQNVADITAGNTDKLRTMFALREGGFTPTKVSDRSALADMFSGASGTESRLGILTGFQRLATNAEAVFAAGTGTQGTGDLETDGLPSTGSPGTLVFEGNLSLNDVRDIVALP